MVAGCTHIIDVQRAFIEPSTAPKQRQGGSRENDAIKLKFQRDGAALLMFAVQSQYHQTRSFIAFWAIRAIACRADTDIADW